MTNRNDRDMNGNGFSGTDNGNVPPPPPPPLPPPPVPPMDSSHGFIPPAYDAPPDQPPPLGGLLRTGPPWEHRDELGFWDAIISTVKESLFSPTEFFSNLRITGGLAQPLIYALIFGVIGSVAGFMINMAFQSMSLFAGLGEERLQGFAFSGVFALVGLFLSPIFVAMGLFISSGIYHLFLYLFGGARHGFEATFRTVCYSQAVALMYFVPICGGLIALVWSLIISIIGLQKTHETDGWRAACAVLVPLVLCCCLIALFFSSIIALIGALAANSSNL